MIDRMLAGRTGRQQNSNANQGGQGGRGGGGGRNMTDAQRDQRSKERIDRTEPKMRRPIREDFGRRLNDRAEERGLPPIEGGPGRGVGGGGPWRG